MNIFIPWEGWEFVEQIGRGQFGSVYKIAITKYGVTEYAAMKVISIPSDPQMIENDYSCGYDRASVIAKYKSFLDQVINEFQLMMKIKGSPNVVRCDDISVFQHEDGIGWDVYIRMECLTPVMKILSEITDEATIIKLGIDLCNALDVCEQENIIHRDIKVSNILISKQGDFKLGDFGVSRTLEGENVYGTKGIGTYDYMAPEVYNGEKYGTTADIYSLGMVLYWLLNDRAFPFFTKGKAPTAQEIETARLRKFSGESLPRPSGGSDALAAVVLKACAFDPQYRYGTAKEMMNDLFNILHGQSVNPGMTESLYASQSVNPAVSQNSYAGETVVLNSASNNGMSGSRYPYEGSVYPLYQRATMVPPAAQFSDDRKNQIDIFCLLGIIFAIIFFPLGLVFSMIGLSTIKRNGKSGRGLANTGLFIFLLWAIAFVIACAEPAIKRRLSLEGSYIMAGNVLDPVYVDSSLTGEVKITDFSKLGLKYTFYNRSFSDNVIKSRWNGNERIMEKPGIYNENTGTLSFLIEVENDVTDSIYYSFYYSDDMVFDEKEIAVPVFCSTISPKEYDNGTCFYEVNCEADFRSGYYAVVITADESMETLYAIAWAEVTGNNSKPIPTYVAVDNDLEKADLNSFTSNYFSFKDGYFVVDPSLFRADYSELDKTFNNLTELREWSEPDLDCDSICDDGVYSFKMNKGKCVSVVFIYPDDSRSFEEIYTIYSSHLREGDIFEYDDDGNIKSSIWNTSDMIIHLWWDDSNNWCYAEYETVITNHLELRGDFFWFDTSLLGKSFKEVKELLDTDMADPEAFIWWGDNLYSTEIDYPEGTITFLFQDNEKLVLVMYDSDDAEMSSEALDLADEEFGDHVEDYEHLVWDCDGFIYEQYCEIYTETDEYHFRQQYVWDKMRG